MGIYGGRQGDEVKDKKGKENTHLMRVRPKGDTESASETEIGEFKVVVLIDQEVLWLQVSVQDTMRVTVEQARNELVREFL